jgi:uncharacterized membrane protein
MSQGQSSQQEVVIKNTESGSNDFTLELSDSMSGLAFLNEKQFTLQGNEQKIVLVTFVAAEDVASDTYVGNLKVISGTNTKQVSIVSTINPNEALFDIQTTIPLKFRRLLAGEELFAELRLLNLGQTGKVDVEIEYTIKDLEGNMILTEKEFVAVETTLSLLKKFQLPFDAKNGDYVLVANVKYEDVTSSASSSFVIVDEKFDIVTVAVLLSFVILLILTIIFFRKYLKTRPSVRRSRAVRKRSRRKSRRRSRR